MPREGQTTGPMWLESRKALSKWRVHTNSRKNAPLKGIAFIPSTILSKKMYFARIALMREFRVMLRCFASSFSCFLTRSGRRRLTWMKVSESASLFTDQGGLGSLKG